MHEVSICEQLLVLLAQEAGRHEVTRVLRLRLEIGRFSCLDPDALRFAFDALAPGTIAHGAVLQIDQPPGRATCLACGAEVPLASRLDACPECGGERLQPIGGEEMRLMEMEAA
jgi:hydrogenase nickel incorporation protein HypA/HybF